MQYSYLKTALCVNKTYHPPMQLFGKNLVYVLLRKKVNKRITKKMILNLSPTLIEDKKVIRSHQFRFCSNE